MKARRIGVLWLLFFTGVVLAEPAKVSLEPLPHLRGDEQILIAVSVPYLGERQSPGDQIGTTCYDWQADGNYGQRIIVDDLGQLHID